MTSLTTLRFTTTHTLAQRAPLLLAIALVATANQAAAFDSPVQIENPAHGTFLDAGSVEVQGRVGAAYAMGTATFTAPYEAEHPSWKVSADGTVAFVGQGYQGAVSAEVTWDWWLGCCSDTIDMDVVIDSFLLNASGGVETLTGRVSGTHYYGNREFVWGTFDIPVTEENLSLSFDGSNLRIGPLGELGQGSLLRGATIDIDLVPQGNTWTVEVNGEVVPVAADETWSTTVTLDQNEIINPIVATATNGVDTYVDRVVVVAGDSLEDGELSSRAVAARVGQSALEAIATGEMVESLIDWEAIGDIKSKECITEVIGCWHWREMEVRATPEVRGETTVDFTFTDEESDVTIKMTDLWISARMSDTWATTGTWCGIEIDTDVTATIKLDFEPDPDDPYKLTIAPGSLSTSTSNFSHKWTYGQCEWDIFNWFFDWFIDHLIEGEVADSINDAFKEEVPGLLDELNVTGLVSGPLEPLGISIDAPFSEVVADSKGLTVIADLGATSTCDPPPGAPTLGASYSEVNPNEDPFPSSGFDPGFNFAGSVSTSAANQILKTQIECGLLMESVEEMDIFNNGTLFPTTLGLLSVVVNALSELTASEENGGHGMDPLTLVRIDIQPTMAPILVSGGGPNGEMLGLKVPQLLIRMVDTGLLSNFPLEGTTPTGRPERLLLEAATDFEVGIDLETLGDEVSFAIGLPPSETIAAVVTGNPFHIDAPAVEGVVPGLVSLFVPALLDALETIPLPMLLDEQIHLSDPYTQGEYMGVYASLGTPTVLLRMANKSGTPHTYMTGNGDEWCSWGAENTGKICTRDISVLDGPVEIRAGSDYVWEDETGRYETLFNKWNQGPADCNNSSKKVCVFDPAVAEPSTTIRALFYEKFTPHTGLMFSAEGDGRVDVEIDGKFVDSCDGSTSCNLARQPGTFIRLHAVPLVIADFVEWDAPCDIQGMIGNTSFCEFTLQEGEDISATARFHTPTIQVTIKANPDFPRGGSINYVDKPGWCNLAGNRQCTLTLPVRGGVQKFKVSWGGDMPFTHWSGACSGSGENCTVDPSDGNNKTVTANFFDDCDWC